MRTGWNLLTGEYPPEPGGISDYTYLLANALAETGDEVHVWTGGAEKSTVTVDGGVLLHRCAGTWSTKDLTLMEEELNGSTTPRRLLVQYAPNAWGYKGLNVHFCRWMLRRRKFGDDVRLMVHEPFYPWRIRDKPTRWLLAVGQRWMIRTLLAASSHVYVSIPSWERYVRAYEPGAPRPITWLPVFSNVPVVIDDELVAQLRQRLVSKSQRIIGSFGTFGGAIGDMLLKILPALLLAQPESVGVLLGRGSEHFTDRLRSSHPSLSDRLLASGELTSRKTSLYLQACDVLVQPYPDGVSSRRGSVMAGLAHGKPIVTTLGRLSEPIWKETNCVALVNVNELESLVGIVEGLFSDLAAQDTLSRNAREVYLKHFSLERTIEKLRI